MFGAEPRNEGVTGDFPESCFIERGGVQCGTGHGSPRDADYGNGHPKP